MAGGPSVGFATLQIVPSLKGIEGAIGSQLGTVTKAGEKAGAEAGAGFGAKFAVAAKVGLVGLTAGIAVFGGLAAIGSSFDEAFDRIRVGTGQTGQSLDALKDNFKSVVSDVPTSFGAAADAITTINQRLGLTGKPLEDISKQFLELSRITGTDLGANIQSVTGLFNNFGIAAADQGKALDELFRTSQATGIAVADLAAQMSTSGIVLRQIGLTFEQSAALLGTLAEQGLSASDVMPALSRSLATAAKAGKPAQQAFEDIFTSIKNAPDSTKAAALALDAFGARAGPKLAALIREGKLSFEDLQKSIAGGSDTILDAAKDTNDWQEALTQLKNKALVALEPVATAAFQGITKGLELLGPAFDKAFAFFKTNLPQIEAIVSTVLAQLGRAFAPVLEAVKKAGPPILSLAKDGFVVLAAGAVLLGKAFLAIAPTLGKIVAGFINLLGFLAKNRDVLAVLVGPIVAVVVAMKIWAAVTKAFTAVQILFNLAMAANPIVLVALAIGVLAAAILVAYKKFKPFHDAVDAVWQALQVLWDFIVRNWKVLGAILLGPFLPFIALAAVIIANWQKVVDFFSGIGAAIADAFNVFIQSDFAQGLLDFITSTFGNIVREVQGALDIIIGIFNVFKAIFTGDWQGLWDALKQIVSGVWQVIGALVAQGINVLSTIVKVGFDALKNIVKVSIDALVQFFLDLPGRLIAAVPAIASAALAIGTSIITSIAKGLQAAVTFVDNIGKAIANAVIGLINKVIDAINRDLEFRLEIFGHGIDVNPPDIGHIPGFASGGIVPGRKGAPLLAVVHGGEQIVTADQQRHGTDGSVINVFGRSDDDMLRKLAIEQRRAQVLA